MCEEKRRPARRALRFNLLLALTIWILWLVFGGKNNQTPDL
jgi:hypothetical protein